MLVKKINRTLHHERPLIDELMLLALIDVEDNIFFFFRFNNHNDV